MKRVWYHPDGVAITHIPGGSPADMDAEGQKLRDAGRDYAFAPHEDFEDQELAAFLPVDRKDRHKWRKNPAGRGCVVDPTVPDRPHPRQALLAKIDSANSVPELKALLTEIVKGGR